MSKEIVLVSIPKDELQTLIIDSVNACLKFHLPKTKRKEELAPGQIGEPFLTKKQAAKKLNCSTSTIDNYARAGKLTRHYLGKTVRFKLEEVLALAKPAN